MWQSPAGAAVGQAGMGTCSPFRLQCSAVVNWSSRRGITQNGEKELKGK